MADENLDVFKDRAGTYLCGYDYAVVSLKDYLERKENSERAAKFRAGFQRVKESSAMSREEYEDLTEHVFDDDEEFREYLDELWAYLYEGGPVP